MSALIILVVLLVIVILAVWSSYNSLVVSKTRVGESWSGIDVQLKRRNDLIPNLIETVKGYAKHEREVFEDVTKARSAILSARGPQDIAKASDGLTTALKSLFAVAENYPELKASNNFKELQDELSDTENKIAYSRQFYNSNVLDYNTKIRMFPMVIMANMFNFRGADFFKAEEGEKEPVKVKF